MGMIERLIGLLFGGGRNTVAETAEVFRVNAEAADARKADIQNAAVAQLVAEFSGAGTSRFDRLMDGLNRVPRPAMALGTLALFVAAMADPVWFAERMQGMALVPEPLWWLLGAIISFYFGARHQAKGQEFHQAIARTMARAPQVVENIRTLRGLRPGTPGTADSGPDARLTLVATEPARNPALEDWKRGKSRELPKK